jgi:hydroxysqualene dehydroxylase
VSSRGAGELRVAVIGGGWAGLAAAVEATARGHRVTLLEMAPLLGGRARRVEVEGLALDNGQHILIGAYVDTLALMRSVGVDISKGFARTPLRIVYPEGAGLELKPGAPLWAFATAVARHRGWSALDRASLLAHAAGWVLKGFRCAASLTVADLTEGMRARVRRELIDPLCVAALNTPANEASARVFLRVLKDALFSGAGSADLLFPRDDLSSLFPDAAERWLIQAGSEIRLHSRVETLTRIESRWCVNGESFDRVVLAATPPEAARLTAGIAPVWSAVAAQLHYEPIVTVYVRSAGARLTAPMLALHADAVSPAQFVFDRGQLSGAEGVLAFVISGAREWVDRGMQATEEATLEQARIALGRMLSQPARVLRTVVEKRATFRCTPGLQRAPAIIAAGLHAAGDHVEGPYPATLEGAVRSGLQAVRAFA